MPEPSGSASAAARALARCDELALLSARDDALERVHLSPQHAAANDLVAAWMRAAGMTAWVDAAGNVCGRVEGREPGLPALLLGSHLDTVPDAGRYDGMLGVVLALEVVEALGGQALDDAGGLPFALEVVGFGDEEGTRFGAALLGSRALAGTWDPSWWDLDDAAGTTLREAFTAFGLDPDRVGEAARAPGELVGYLEAHIEQGPHLESADLSLGYVTTIAGARRITLRVVGEARHAGGTPYSRRHDALTGASEVVLAIEELGRSSGDAGVIATVGRLEVQPGAVNVVPGRVDLSLDLRAATDDERDAMWTRMHARAVALCAARGLTLEVTETHSAPAVPCASWLADAVVAGIRVAGSPTDSVDASTGHETEPMGLWSRAGHDAMAVAAVTDVGMLFVRCHDGISHHPDEDVRETDVARAVVALEAAVLEVAAQVAARVPAQIPVA